MKKYAPGLISLGGTAAAVVVFVIAGPAFGGLIALATLAYAASCPNFIGRTPLNATTNINPSAVRRYREENPGTTISDAVAALTVR